VIGMWITGLS